MYASVLTVVWGIFCITGKLQAVQVKDKVLEWGRPGEVKVKWIAMLKILVIIIVTIQHIYTFTLYLDSFYTSEGIAEYHNSNF